jgi:hypothetical protein
MKACSLCFEARPPTQITIKTNNNIFLNTFKVHNILNNAEPVELQKKLPLPLPDLVLSVKQNFLGQNNTFGPGNLIPGVGPILGSVLTGC